MIPRNNATARHISHHTHCQVTLLPIQLNKPMVRSQKLTCKQIFPQFFYFFFAVYSTVHHHFQKHEWEMDGTRSCRESLVKLTDGPIVYQSKILRHPAVIWNQIVVHRHGEIEGFGRWNVRRCGIITPGAVWLGRFARRRFGEEKRWQGTPVARAGRRHPSSSVCVHYIFQDRDWINIE